MVSCRVTGASEAAAQTEIPRTAVLVSNCDMYTKALESRTTLPCLSCQYLYLVGEVAEVNRV